MNGDETPNPPATGILLPSGQPAKPERGKSGKKPLSDSLLILGITAFCYSCVFAFEGGYCQVFGIPWDLIHLDMTRLLVMGSVSLTVLMLVYQVGTILLMSFALGSKVVVAKRVIVQWLITRLLLLVIVLLIGFFEGYSSTTFWCLFLPLVVDIAAEIVFPYSEKRKDPKQRSFAYHLVKWQDAMKSNPKPSLVDESDKIGMGAPILVLLGLNICVFVSFHIGKQLAIREDRFLYRSTPRQEIVLRVYGNTAITARIDDKSNVYPEFRFIKMDEQTNEFSFVNTGRLNPILPEKKKKNLPIQKATNNVPLLMQTNTFTNVVNTNLTNNVVKP